MKKTMRALTLLAGLSAPAGAATLCVDPAGTGGCLTTIQAAVDAAAPRDLIQIHPGLYFEGVLVPAGKDGLVIEGTDREKVIIDSSPFADRGFAGAEATFRLVAPEVKVRNLTMRNGVVGVWVDGPGCEVSGIRFRGTDGAVGITFEADDVLVDASEIEDAFSGVSIVGHRAVVRGTVFRRVAFGVSVDTIGADDLFVVNNKFEGGLDALLLGTDEVYVARNEFSGLSGLPIQVVGNNPFIHENVIRDSTFGIIALCIDEDIPGGNEPPECFNAYATRNRITGTSEVGIRFQTKAFGMRIEDNFLERTGEGIVGASPADHSVIIQRNEVRQAGTGLDDDCFDVFVGDVRNNVASKCGQAGFHTRAVDLFRNTTFDNAENGFTLDGDMGPDLAVVGNTAIGNQTRGNAAQGIAIVRGPFGGPFQLQVIGNTALGNRVDFCDEGEATFASANNIQTQGPCAVLH